VVPGPQLAIESVAVNAKAAARERRCVVPGIAFVAMAALIDDPQKGQARSPVRMCR
jgi:hypothetical protein